MRSWTPEQTPTRVLVINFRSEYSGVSLAQHLGNRFTVTAPDVLLKAREELARAYNANVIVIGNQDSAKKADLIEDVLFQAIGLRKSVLLYAERSAADTEALRTQGIEVCHFGDDPAWEQKLAAKVQGKFTQAALPSRD